MTPKWGPIENSFKLIKHHTKVNAYTKFGSNRPKNLREKLHQLKMRRDVETYRRRAVHNPYYELPIRQLKTLGC